MLERESNLSSESVVVNPVNSSKQKKTSETGTSPQTLAFLLEIIRTEAYLKIDVRRRNLIGLYFGTEATLNQLTGIAQVKTRERVRQLITSGIKRMWQNLPPDLQEKYPLETVIQLKSWSTPKTREKLRAKWRDPEYRERMVKICQKQWQNPEYRAKMRKIKRQLWRDPEYRAKMSKILKGRVSPTKGKNHSLETRAKISAIAKANWRKPEFREKMRKAHQGKTRSSEARARMSQAQKAKWQEPGHREKMSMIFKGRISPMKGKTHSPETRAKISEAVKQALRKKGNRSKEEIAPN